MRILLSFFLLINLSFAQEEKKLIDSISEKDIEFEKVKQDRLLRIRRELVTVQNQIFETKELLKNTNESVERFKLEVSLAKLVKEEEQLRFEFIETSTNISIDFNNDKNKKAKTTLTENIQAILRPAFNSIRSISESPRQIQVIKDRITEIDTKITQAKSAKSILESSLEDLKERKLVNSYKKSLILVETELKKLHIYHEDARFKLIKLEKAKGSIVTNFSKAMFNFFKTKGKNLLIALSIFIIFIWVFRLGRNKFIVLFYSKVRTRIDSTHQYDWLARPIRVIYSVFSVIMAVFMGIVALYVLDDWVLVTLIIFILGGVVWSLRSYLPSFVEQSKIVLNLGAVREGERVVYKGLPWQIKNLGYYCRMVNPALKGGHFRINTRELIHHTSRPINENEPWFPTKANDWVVLSDKTFGKIAMQTPEQINIKLIGGQTKFLNTVDFLALNPINLSNDFGLEITFGIDYDHQVGAIDSFLLLFKKEFSTKLESMLPGMYEDFKDISVEFKEAGANSLDYRFFLRCNGKLASQMQFLERRVHTAFVEICNENDITIPFSQLRVHMDKA